MIAETKIHPAIWVIAGKLIIIGVLLFIIYLIL